MVFGDAGRVWRHANRARLRGVLLAFAACLAVLPACRSVSSPFSKDRNFVANLADGTVRIESRPPGATVYELKSNDDPVGNVVGTTPCTLKIETGVGRAYRLELPGYVPSVVDCLPTPTKPDVVLKDFLRKVPRPPEPESDAGFTPIPEHRNWSAR